MPPCFVPRLILRRFQGLVRHLPAIVKWQILKLITLTLALSLDGEGTSENPLLILDNISIQT